VQNLANPPVEGGAMKDFKEFLLRGNLVELAVAVVIGVAFGALVTSLVEDLITPLIAAIGGQQDFSALDFTINDSVFRYGAFITDVVQFIAIAAAVFFFIVKPVQLARAQRTGRDAEEEAPSDEERRHQELLAALRAG
jgi:large conductance mechanosensitive channel